MQKDEPSIPIVPEDDSTMFEDMETLNEENIKPVGNSPFGVAPVDPLVFKKTTDSPELRAAAAYVPISATPAEREKPPEQPTKKDYSSWTPGTPTGVTAIAEPPKTHKKPNFQKKEKNVPIEKIKPDIGNSLKIIFTIIAIIVPLAMLAGAIYIGVMLVG